MSADTDIGPAHITLSNNGSLILALFLKKVTLPQRAQFHMLNLKFLNSSQIYVPSLIYFELNVPGI